MQRQTNNGVVDDGGGGRKRKGRCLARAVWNFAGLSRFKFGKRKCVSVERSRFYCPTGRIFFFF